MSSTQHTRHITRRRFVVVFLLTMCALAAAALLVRPGTSVPPREVLLTATADTYVSAARPKDQHGDDVVLRVDSVPTRFVALMTFRLPVLGPSVTRATLRLHAASPNVWGAAVTAVDRTPDDATTWRTRPRTTDLAGVLPASPRPGWVTLDVTHLATPGEPLSLALYGRGPTMAVYDSRESAGLGPQLVVRFG